MKAKLTASNLKEHLWDILHKIDRGVMPAYQASAVASCCREIVRCTNAQIKISAHTGRDVPKSVVDFSEN